VNRTVLFVDDELNIRHSFERLFRDHYDVILAADAVEGLAAIERRGAPAVIVSDMRMPGVDGISFLAEVRERSPDSVRIMLTGYANLEIAVNAVNQGEVFRFLTKPCSEEALTVSITAAMDQYSLVIAEREVLEDTLNGSIHLLSDVLSMVNPAAFSRATHTARYAKGLAEALHLPDAWRFELAGMLSQIGCLALPSELLEKTYTGADLTPSEKEMYQAHPGIGSRLLANIPRLEIVANMIEDQQRPYSSYASPQEVQADCKIGHIGAQILHVALAVENLAASGLSAQNIKARLRTEPDEYNPHIVDAVTHITISSASDEVHMCLVKDLRIGMLVEQDIHASNGQLLVPRGQQVSFPVLIRLRNFADGVGVVEPFRVRAGPAS
jgi:response regulator RpfG family c-di-GMP phosphodiesterase